MFEECAIEGANLRMAKMENTFSAFNNWRGADLRGAKLDDAYLPFSNLSGARLNGASLVGAGLLGTNLIGANLEGVDAKEALVDNAMICKKDLIHMRSSIGTPIVIECPRGSDPP